MKRCCDMRLPFKRQRQHSFATSSSQEEKVAPVLLRNLSFAQQWQSHFRRQVDAIIDCATVAYFLTKNSHSANLSLDRSSRICVAEPPRLRRGLHLLDQRADQLGRRERSRQRRTLVRPLRQFDELFEIDAQARKQGLSQEDRELLRLEKSKPLLEQIKSQIQAARTSALPKSVLAKACNYTLTLWTRLTRFVEHPELELSNNLAENSMRPVALGRRNWIHIGSEETGPRVAAIVSIVETCRRLKI